MSFAGSLFSRNGGGIGVSSDLGASGWTGFAETMPVGASSWSLGFFGAGVDFFTGLVDTLTTFLTILGLGEGGSGGGPREVRADFLELHAFN